MSKASQSVDAETQSEPALISRRTEQLVAVAGILISALGTIVPAIVGAPLRVVTTIGLAIFVALTGSNIYYTQRNARLSKILAIIAAFLVFGLTAANVQLGQGKGGEETGKVEIVRPPRLEINAWIDLPMVERSLDGREVHLDGNGKRDPREKTIIPVKLISSSRSEPRQFINLPAQFNEFDPGDTVTASFCDLTFSKKIPDRTDKLFADQIVWDIPVKLTDAKHC